jgi:transposase
LAKRLEAGRFSWPEPNEATGKLALAPEAFALLVNGVDLKRGTLKPWYQK